MPTAHLHYVTAYVTLTLAQKWLGRAGLHPRVKRGNMLITPVAATPAVGAARDSPFSTASSPAS